MEKIRISKLLAAKGLCSRREADRYIEEGLVSVNGTTVRELGTKASLTDHIALVTEARELHKQKATVMLHKPLGIVSNLPEKGYKEASSLIMEETHWEHDLVSYREIEGSLHVAGRLDINSKGLLLLTQDGRVAQRVIHPQSKIEKEYILRFEGDCTEKKCSLLQEGLFLDGKKLKRAVVEKKDRNTLRVILVEGKKRQLRRMCEQLDLFVTSIKRVRVGNLQLGNLPSGKWRFVDPKEIG